VVVFVLGGMARGQLFFAPDGMSIRPVWWLATLALAVGLAAACKPRAPAFLLTLAAALFGAQHVPPTGSLGLACFVAAAAYVEFRRRRPVLGLASTQPGAS